MALKHVLGQLQGLGLLLPVQTTGVREIMQSRCPDLNFFRFWAYREISKHLSLGKACLSTAWHNYAATRQLTACRFIQSKHTASYWKLYLERWIACFNSATCFASICVISKARKELVQAVFIFSCIVSKARPQQFDGVHPRRFHEICDHPPSSLPLPRFAEGIDSDFPSNCWHKNCGTSLKAEPANRPANTPWIYAFCKYCE